MIDPNIWEDPEFASLSRDARLLFIGLISNADDEGYLRGHPGALKRLVFGFDNDMSTDAIQLLINELQEKLKHSNLYVVDNQIYIHICTWFKYQKQQKDRIVPTIFPLCSKCIASDKHLLTEVKLSKEKLREVNTDDEQQQFSKKKTNPLVMSKGQQMSYLKAFPSLTSTELKVEIDKCNTYMGMSSTDYGNPGLFLKKWLTRYMSERSQKRANEKKLLDEQKALEGLPEDQRFKNIERLDKIRGELKERLVI